jgi:hypothetical protein
VNKESEMNDLKRFGWQEPEEIKVATPEEAAAMKRVIEASAKPRLRLVGADGNAFNLLGLAQRAARKAGWSEEQWKAVRDHATAGDYDHLLAVLQEEFDVE